jgi:hypothetical protein
MTRHKKLHRILFTVAGTGEFPHDMLRYDGCRGAEVEDEAKIDWSYSDPAPDGATPLYEVGTYCNTIRLRVYADGRRFYR